MTNQRTMPFYWISRAIFDLRPSATALAAYNLLADLGDCDISLQKMAKRMHRCAPERLQRGLDELERKGAIRVIRHPEDGRVEYFIV